MVPPILERVLGFDIQNALRAADPARPARDWRLAWRPRLALRGPGIYAPFEAARRQTVPSAEIGAPLEAAPW